jgi:hypothetical protein
MVDSANGTAQEELDMGVVLYSCSFVVISLMILSQVWPWPMHLHTKDTEVLFIPSFNFTPIPVGSQ